MNLCVHACSKYHSYLFWTFCLSDTLTWYYVSRLTLHLCLARVFGHFWHAIEQTEILITVNFILHHYLNAKWPGQISGSVDIVFSWMQFIEFLEKVQPRQTGLTIPKSKRPLEYAKDYGNPSSNWPHAEVPKPSSYEQNIKQEVNLSYR